HTHWQAERCRRDEYCETARPVTSSSSVDGPEHRYERRKAEPSLALGHGLCIKLLRCGSGGSSRLLLDQTDQRLRCLGANAPHWRNGLRGTAERLLPRPGIFFRA